MCGSVRARSQQRFAAAQITYLVEGPLAAQREVQLQVLAQDRQVHQLELRLARLADHRLPGRPAAAASRVEIHHLAEQGEVGLVGGQPKHDQVGVLAVHAVALVRRVVRLGPRLADVLHDLVLALARHVVPAEHNLQVAPQGVLLDLLADEPTQVLAHELHELRPGRDAVGVEDVVFVHDLPPLTRLGHAFHAVLRRTETTRTLLVQLRTRGHAVDGHEEQLLGLGDLRDHAVNVAEDGQHHLAQGQAAGRAVVVGVRARVDDAVHVQVQVVDLRQQCAVGDHLVDLRVTLAEPAIELGNTHGGESLLVVDTENVFV